MKIKKMYINKTNKLNYRARLRIIKQLTVYRRKPSDLARQYRVSRQTIYAIHSRYKKDGLYGIEDHRPGVKRHTLNHVVYGLITQIRLTTDYSRRKDSATT